MSGVHLKGVLYLPPLPPRRVYVIEVDPGDMLAIVWQGGTMPWAWARLPGIERQSSTIRWKWSRVARSRALAIGTTSAVTADSARVAALLARLKKGPPKRVGRLVGHVEGERVCDCCDRADEYNGFDSGPTIFTCPKHCACHD